jgi:hypothetical protein
MGCKMINLGASKDLVLPQLQTPSDSRPKHIQIDTITKDNSQHKAF